MEDQKKMRSYCRFYTHTHTHTHTHTNSIVIGIYFPVGTLAHYDHGCIVVCECEVMDLTSDVDCCHGYYVILLHLHTYIHTGILRAACRCWKGESVQKRITMCDSSALVHLCTPPYTHFEAVPHTCTPYSPTLCLFFSLGIHVMWVVCIHDLWMFWLSCV